MQQPLYQGQPLAGTLETLLHEACMERQMPTWRLEYCCISQGFFMESLRRLLGALDISNWFEITAGMSWRQYRALDLYVRVFSAGLLPPEEVAWYLLNLDSNVQYRHKPLPGVV